MKSKRAEELIHQFQFDGNAGYKQISVANAVRAIEKAEADCDAKAVEAHRLCCPYYAELEEQMSRCQLATECIECKYMKSFIEKLNK